MSRGNLIVFEGIDGSGTSTQSAELRRAFVERGLPAHLTAQPSGGPIGSMIRQVLTGRLVIPGSRPLGWKTMGLLFAADRQDQQEAEIEPNLRDGINVICDRYVQSSAIYQSTNADDPAAVSWILQINKFIRPPDLVFYLKIEAAAARERRRARSGAVEIYDDHAFQLQLVEAYEELEQMFPDTKIVTLDGTRPREELAAEVWATVERLRSKGAPA
jgi:dTMP kinase